MGHEEELRSDADGYVRFPRRAIRTNLIAWTAKFLARLVNVHSGFGPSAAVYYLGEHPAVSVPGWYQPGTLLGSEIVVNASVTK